MRPAEAEDRCNLTGTRQGGFQITWPTFLFRLQPNAKERRQLSKVEALNDFPETGHRRNATWQVESPLYGDLLLQDATPFTLQIMVPAEWRL